MVASVRTLFIHKIKVMQMKRTIQKILAILALTFMAGSALAAEKPNIVLINMDNFGYGEPGVYGGGITRGGATFLRYCNGVLPPLRRKKA